MLPGSSTTQCGRTFGGECAWAERLERPRYDIRKRSLLVSGLMVMKPFCAPLSNPLPRPRINPLNREERGGGLTRHVARASLNRPLAMWGLAPRRQFPKSEGRVG